jgi:amidase
MKRRDFVRLTSTAGLSALALPFAQCQNSQGNDNLKNDAFELAELTISQLQAKMERAELTSRAVTQLYLDQISKIDKNGPMLNAVIEINPDALSIAAVLDEERKKGKLRGPLHGIPILIKDNINTADKMQTTAGAIALEGNIAESDAFLVKQLRNAGAVILGKTNLSEWANFRSTRSSSGWSSRGGQTRNPYILDRSPCGSSSGSGVAVAANLCAVSVGTETNGSIACPASMNSVVGIKPTVGLISRSGIIPISKTQDTAGPFGRTVADAAALLGAMTGHDPEDAATSEAPDKSPTDYTLYLNRYGLKGKRIGIEKAFLKEHERVDVLFRNAIDQMKKLGATIVEVDYMKTQKLDGAESTLFQYEFKEGVNAYLSKSNAKVKSLDEVIAFNKSNEDKAMPTFKQELLEVAVTKGNLDAKDYKEALRKVLNVRKLLLEELDKNKLDALCGPATGPAWCIDPVNGDFWTGYGSYGPAAVSGFPSITVPMGDLNEIPIGISFLGRAYDEPGLISIAYAYEQISKNRKPPRFLQSVK